MKILGPLMVALGLVLGVLSGTTAYLVPVDRIDPARDRVELHAPAGQVGEPGEVPRAVLEPGPAGAPLVIGEEELRILREAGVSRVHVKQFSLRLWREWWLFGVAAGLLLGGAVVGRRARRLELEKSAAAGAGASDVPTPALLDEALEVAQRLAEAIDPARVDDESVLRRLRDGVDDLRERFFEPLEFGRAAVVEQLGMAGYARMMDRFAAAERQFNRAWSAAADHVGDEAVKCLREGVKLLAEARERYVVGGSRD